jgi:hypothetical protein
LKVHQDTLTDWKKKPGFANAVTAAARARLIDHLPSIYGALIRMADMGHYEHIKLALEMAGEYVRVSKNVNESSGEMVVRFVVGEREELPPPITLIDQVENDADDD